MPNLLLAESGSTKTDWRLFGKKGKLVSFRTSGINPYLQSSDEIHALLHSELGWDEAKHKADTIHFYGAGAASDKNSKAVQEVLQKFFGVEKITVQGDLMAAARAMCGTQKGVVCILGTGSNSCYYNGDKIAEQMPSLGYVAGDEGSGNHMGKRVLQYYAYKTFDTELMMGFEMLFGNDLSAILHKIYREPFPNRYLASMTQLLTANRGHFMVENIVEDCLSDFFQHHILKYRHSWKHPLHFAGSVAFTFKDVLEELCRQYELDLGTVIQSPLDGLVKYHRDLL